MALEVRLVGGDVLDPDAIFVAAGLDDPVDEQERIAVRQERQKLLDVEAVERPNGRFVHCVLPSLH